MRKVQTKAAAKFWQALNNGKVCDLEFRRQHAFDDYILDFYCDTMKLAIEADAALHNDPEVAAYDIIRTKI